VIALAPGRARLEEAHLPQKGTSDGQLERDDRLEKLHRYAHTALLSDMTSRTINLMRAASRIISAEAPPHMGTAYGMA
jgi:hypothetical protein